MATSTNINGNLGNGSLEHSSIPVKIMDDVASASAGAHHDLALKKDGTVWTWGSNDVGSIWAWGKNDYSQLGDGTLDDKDELILIYITSAPNRIIGAYLQSKMMDSYNSAQFYPTFR